MELKPQRLFPYTGIITLLALFIAYSDTIPHLVIFSPTGEIFQQTIKGMENEFEGEFSTTNIEISKETSVEKISSTVAAEAPDAIILMGNRSIRLYKRHLKAHSFRNDTIPVVALLASQVEKAVATIKNVQSISYETPMITALLNFRNIIGRNIKNVGVAYRPIYHNFIEEHTKFCEREKMSVKAIQVCATTKQCKKDLKNALKELVQKDKVDAFWIPNDNRLLTPKLLQTLWIPYFKTHNIPVIVGVEPLVTKEINFGSFAVMPEPLAMGEQAADIIFTLRENNWRFEANTSYPAISVYSVLNLDKLSGYTPETLNLNEVTKTIK